jgi:hypothetical protein
VIFGEISGEDSGSYEGWGIRVRERMIVVMDCGFGENKGYYYLFIYF